MVVVDGRKSVAMVDGKRSGQRHPGGRPGGRTEPNTLEAHPYMRVHCPSRKPLRGGGHQACPS